MPDRSALGAADVSDAELASIVAGYLGETPSSVELLDVTAEVVPYELESLTTAGRYWVQGTARTGTGDVPFRFFVKHVQSWSRSPLFESVPPEYRELAESNVPWRAEPLLYRSDLGARLPAGLAMPRAAAVRDIDEKSSAVWLEKIEVVPRVWSVDQLGRAARLLGRLAASPAVRELAAIGSGPGQQRFVRLYVFGRLSMQVLPVLRSDEVWHHPVVAGAFDDDLRARMLAAADRVTEYVDELERVPLGTSHGDACTNNILVRGEPDDLVLIDFGFWAEQPLGFDLGQLLIGDVQLGRRSADDLPEVESACLPAYVDGLRDEGDSTPAAVVQRAHALQMLIYTGLSAIPVEMLAAPPTPEVMRIAGERANATRFILDLVDGTVPIAEPHPGAAPAGRPDQPPVWANSPGADGDSRSPGR